MRFCRRCTFGRNGDQAQIAFHSRHLPKSVTTPSDTCKMRSAVWAMLWLWVIITMVCSYFLDASFSRAMTSLVFCVSRLPVGSSARIRAGTGNQGAANRDTLLLSAGKLAGQMVAPCGQAQHRQQFFQILFIGLLVVQQHRENDILLHRQLRDQVEALEDKADISYGGIPSGCGLSSRKCLCRQ